MRGRTTASPSSGALLRELHDAGSTFHPPPDATWQPWFTRSDDSDTVYGHGDVGPWNIVARDGLPVGLIDWEFAGPVDRLAVAQAGWLNAQLHDDDIAARNQLPSAAEHAHQLRLFVDAYGLVGPARSQLVTRMVNHAGFETPATSSPSWAPSRWPRRRPVPRTRAGGSLGTFRSAAWLVAHRPMLEAAIR